MSALSSSSQDDVLKILIATDIHLGYAEKNPLRKDDSFNTFEEILEIALAQKVDMVLLGGDLFHDNKPSRNSEMKCSELLRKYVLGDNPISLEFLSDPKENFKHCSTKEVNYENPNLNIGLPVFSIHGNHDDPAGLGSYSCMDLLHTFGLVNYFGRVDNLDSINITPLLMKKGETKLALFGLSSIKDERLHRLFKDGKVKINRPNEETDSWFNIFVLHQNRVKHGPYNYIPEHFIEGFFDLVFWGHEHECRIEPEEAYFEGEKKFFITQPGSPVATSLCEAESKPKCVGLLQIRKKEFMIDKIPLKTVRPMVFQTLSIDEANINLRGSDKEVQRRIEQYLQQVVEEMIQEADNKFTGHPKQPKLPLLRLRVEYSEEKHQLAPGRFGNNFHNRVANPNEILLFRKKTTGKKSTIDTSFDADLMSTLHLQEELEGTSMEDLLSDYFKSTEDKAQLKVLGVQGIAAAVKNFVEKDDKDALDLIVERQVERTFGALEKRDLEDVDDESIDGALEAFRQERVQKEEASEARKILAEQNRVVRRRSDADADRDGGSLIGSDDTEEQENIEDLRRKSSARGRGRGRGKARNASGNREGTGRTRSSRNSSSKTPTSRGRGNGQSTIKKAFAQQAALDLRRSTNYVADTDSE